MIVTKHFKPITKYNTEYAQAYIYTYIKSIPLERRNNKFYALTKTVQSVVGVANALSLMSTIAEDMMSPEEPL